MFIYIPRHLNNVEIVSQMTDLLREYIKNYGSRDSYKSFDYYYYYYTVDPVKNFIRMCLTKNDTPVDEGVLWYLIKLFYSVKGTPKVLDLMESHLGLKFKTNKAGKKYTYDNYKISYDLEEVESFNLNTFMEGQEKFLSSLLYYSDFTEYIDKAELMITDQLESEISFLNWNYTKYEV